MKWLVVGVICALAVVGTNQGQALAGTIEGTVRPVEWAQEVEVCIAEPVPGERCMVPKADGSYSIPGIEGQFELEFVPTYRSRMLTQFYDHQSTFAEANPVSVSSNGVVKGVDADLVEGGTITGVVTGASGGAPLAEVEVCATSLEMSKAKSCDQTDSSGSYELHSLPTGIYKLNLRGRGQSAEYVSEDSPLVAVTASMVTSNIDFALVKGGQIRGAVFAADAGVALQGIPVCAFAVLGAAAEVCTESGLDGSYALVGIAPGSYQVGFALDISEVGGTGSTSSTATGYLPQYFDDVASRAEARPLNLSGSEVVDGINAALSEPNLTPPPLASPAGSGGAAPTPIISEPTKRAPFRCGKGRKKRKVRGVHRCVKAKPSKKRRKHRRGRVRSAARAPSTTEFSFFVR